MRGSQAEVPMAIRWQPHLHAEDGEDGLKREEDPEGIRRGGERLGEIEGRSRSELGADREEIERTSRASDELGMC